jgi:DNA-binding beta-propeller fold protein YncE
MKKQAENSLKMHTRDANPIVLPALPVLWLSALMLLAPDPVRAFELVFVAASAQDYAEPHDIVLSPDQRYLYVADNNHHRIAVLDPDSLEQLGTFGENEVGAPHDVVFDDAGRLLVADTNNSRIAIYRVDGAQAGQVGELKGSIRRPEGVAVHPNGRVYATGAGSGNIVAFENGAVVAEADGFSSPHDVAVAPDGSLWVADANNDRLVHMTPELDVIGIVEGSPYDFNGPRYLDFDAAGRLYVADKYSHQIKILSGDDKATLLLTLGSGESGLGPNLFDRPEGITIRGADVWFADTYNDRIVRYRINE